MQASEVIRKIADTLLDLVYPPGLYCLCCGKISDPSRTYGLCNDCMQAVNWVTDRHCSRCGRPLSNTDTAGQCFSCRGRSGSSFDHSFDKGHACTGYGACERALIFAFKYGSRSDMADTFGEIMYDRMTAEYEPDELAGMYDMVVPVPIYSEKKRRRGFNHADLMARSFADRAGLFYEPALVVRSKETMPMKALSPEERRCNIEGAFRLRERKLPLLDAARVLIIDDIYTTGATVNEIAALLKQPRNGRSGASRVDFLAFAAASDMIIN